MSANGINALDATLQTTHIWLDDVMRELGWMGERQKANQALRAELHALRDRLPVENAAHFAAQLPMLVRGFYYEGWSPSPIPADEHTADQFLFHVTEALEFDSIAASQGTTRRVFRVLTQHMTAGVIEKVKHVLPKSIRDLWPEPDHAPR